MDNMNIEQTANVLNNYFEKYGKELEETESGSTGAWEKLFTALSNKIFDISGEGIHIYDIQIIPENIQMLADAVINFDRIVTEILGYAIHDRWEKAKRSLQYFIVKRMDPEQAEMFSSRILSYDNPRKR